MPPALIGLLQPLLSNGLNLVANAVLAKGKQWTEDKLGVSIKPDMTSEDLAKVQIAAMEHEEELKRLAIEEDRLDLAKMELGVRDTIDARQREANIVTNKDAPLLNKIITPVLALGLLSLTFLLFAIVMFDNTPVESTRKDLLVYVLGVLSAISNQIVAYYFGSSIGSKDKAEQLKDVLK
jgi:hypothetical protein